MHYLDRTAEDRSIEVVTVFDGCFDDAFDVARGSGCVRLGRCGLEGNWRFSSSTG